MKALFVIGILVAVAALAWWLTPRCERVVTPWYGYTRCQ